RTRLKTILSNSTLNNRFNELYTATPDSIVNSFREIFDTRKWILSSTLNTQFSKQHALRTGIIASHINFNYLQKSRENTHAPVEERINVKDQTRQLQAFAQWQYKPTDQLMITGGLHYMHFMLNNSSSIEPRAAIQWTPDAKNSF